MHGPLHAGLTQRQRQRHSPLLGDALVRETETLARALQIVTNNALQDRRFRDLNEVLQSAVEDPETFMVIVSDRQGTGLPGRWRTLTLLASPTRPPAAGRSATRIRWVVLPVRAPASTLLLARRATLMEREIAASRRRHLLLTLTLTAAAALAILIVLQWSLSRPLAEIMRGVQSLGNSNRRSPVRVHGSAGELADLASAFNSMTAQIEEQQNLLRETEEARGAGAAPAPGGKVRGDRETFRRPGPRAGLPAERDRHAGRNDRRGTDSAPAPYGGKRKRSRTT